MISDTVGNDFRIGDRHVRLHMRMQRLELAKDLRQIKLRNRGARAQQQGSADGTGQFTDAGFEFFRQGQDFFGITEHQFTCRCQRNATMIAFKQPRIEVLFQLLDLEGHRRLRHE